MSNLKFKTKLSFTAEIELTEAEIMALDGIFGYDVNMFLAVFYERMGKAYVQPYEAGVRSLHKEIRAKLAPHIAKIKEARQKLGLQ